MVFKFESDTAAEFQAFNSNQLQAIYPQPQIDVVDAIKAGIVERQHADQRQHGLRRSIWLNNAQAAVHRQAVRQALGYAIDRDAVVKQLFGKLGVKSRRRTRSTRSRSRTTRTSTRSSDTSLDLDKVTSLMTGAGWAQGLRRYLGQGRQEGRVHAHHHRRATSAGSSRRRSSQRS